MMLKLNKALFSRNRRREQEIGDIFNKTSNGITNLMPFIIPLFFTPVLITSSLFSKEIIVMLANISLSLGYISSFSYHAYYNEVSKAEILISTLLLIAATALAYYLSPPLMAFTFIKGLIFLNQAAAAINLFFLVKHVIIPPFKQIIEKIAHYFGYDISAGYYSKPPLTLEKDRFIIDKLLLQTYDHDSFSPEFQVQELSSFNKLLNMLCRYINKYNESIFGYIFNKDAIANLDSQVAQLTIQGSIDSSYAFIHKKIGFKTTKIHLLEVAEKAVLSALKDPNSDATAAMHFFQNVDQSELKNNRNTVLSESLLCVQEEIKRQQEKIHCLEECLPPSKHNKPEKIIERMAEVSNHEEYSYLRVG